MNAFKPWKIIQLEMDQGIFELPSESGVQGLFVVFWWHGIPLGDRWIPAAQLPMSVTQLTQLAAQTIAPSVGDRLLACGFRESLPVVHKNLFRDRAPDLTAVLALTQPLQTLSDQLTPSPPLSTSVVICTRDRPEQLAECLRSLQHLSHRADEIIVVDNAPSSDATYQVVAQFPQIRYVLEPQPGLSAARNAGIRQATCDLVAFTDDDVIVHADWILRLQQGFRDPNVMAVTGLMLPAELETEAQLIFQGGPGLPGWGYRALTFTPQFFEEMKPRGVPVWRIGAGANMAFRRKIFSLVGEFHPQLGAGASGCSEDSELWYRILASGWQCRYDPSSVVFHYHRKDLASLKRQMHQYIKGHVYALLVQFEQHRHWGNIRRLLVALPRYYWQQWRSGLRNGFRGKQTTLWAEITGCVAGVVLYFKQKPSNPPINKPCELTSMTHTLSTPSPVSPVSGKANLGDFLAQNPFPHPLTQGFFYREKMRAIHRISPNLSFQTILEVGGGQGGLTAMLYPNAHITNIDLNPTYADVPCNQTERVTFICGDATALPFESASFDAVTMFDLIEHVPDDQQAIAEALRVLKPGGYLLLSTPNEHWKFPYYGFMKPICPDESVVMAEWGHVRRGYTLSRLEELVGQPALASATFINPLTALCHDVAFSSLSTRKREALCWLISPLTWSGYVLHQPNSLGTETAVAWQK
jgi:GT2 family glycosyltransferase/SAM-dependent methyltransferase